MAAPSLVIASQPEYFCGIISPHFSRCSPARPFANSASRQPHLYRPAGRRYSSQGFPRSLRNPPEWMIPTAGDLFLALKGIDGSQPEKSQGDNIQPNALGVGLQQSGSPGEGRDLSGRSCEYIVRPPPLGWLAVMMSDRANACCCSAGCGPAVRVRATAIPNGSAIRKP